MGDGGELERALVDVSGTGKTVPSCRAKQFEKKTLQKTLKFSDCRESIRKQIRPSRREESFESVLCLFGFVKAAKFRDSSEYSDCIQNVCAKSCLPCQIL